MTEWAPAVASVIAALGIGGILSELVKRAIDALTGRGKKRRDEVQRAWGHADREAMKRRIAEEYASRQTRRLIEAPCVDTTSIEQFPTYPPKES